MYKQDYELGHLHRTMKVLEVETNLIESMSETERLQYKLDPQKFNKIRCRTIEKVYGEMGKQKLTMLPQNPIKAIPILYSRFKMSFDRQLADRKECESNWRE